MALGGSDKKVTLWNKDGVHLGTLAQMQDWVWSVSVCPSNEGTVHTAGGMQIAGNKSRIFSGANNGAISSTSLEVSQINGLYQDRYAYRELMTDVII